MGSVRRSARQLFDSLDIGGIILPRRFTISRLAGWLLLQEVMPVAVADRGRRIVPQGQPGPLSRLKTQRCLNRDRLHCSRNLACVVPSECRRDDGQLAFPDMPRERSHTSEPPDGIALSRKTRQGGPCGVTNTIHIPSIQMAIGW